MRKTSLLLFIAAAALAQSNGSLSSTTDRPIPGFQVNSGTATLASGVRIRYRSVATPDGASLNLVATGASMSQEIFHRFVIDKTTRSYFGYDLAVSAPDSNNRYQVIFAPLTADTKMITELAEDPSLKPMMLPKYPAPQMVREGDLIALDLMVSADGKRKLTDYIEVVAPPGSAPVEPGTESADYTLDDGPVTFRGLQHNIWVNGQSKVLEGYTQKPGATFWIAIPGSGRYIVSLAPHDGFVKSGTLHGDTLTFHDGAQRYDVRFEQPAVTPGKVWNLYVFHDLSYTPNAALANGISAGTDRLDNLLGFAAR